MLIVERSESIAETVHNETGKPKVDAFNTEVMSSVAAVKEYERLMMKFIYEQKLDQSSMSMFTRFLRRTSYIRYLPLGVVAVISPYNFPFSIPFIETVAAVAAGNGVVLKPSSETPLSGELIGELFKDAGFPDDLVMVIHGPGIGAALSVAGADKIIFTGSTEVGREIMKNASVTLTPVTLELGGKDAMIVLEDADIERAADCATWGSFVNAGQVCAGIKRIFVHRSVYEEFKERFVKKTRTLKIGDGWNDPDVSVGPMINSRELERIVSVCRKAEEQNGRILTGGKKLERKGYFFEPTVIEGVDHTSDIVRNEIFGPVVMLFPFSDENDTVTMAKDSDFALGGSVWTQDLRKGKEIAFRLGSGTVDVNNSMYTFGLPATPWGGRGNSGFGITHGELGFRELMFPHHVHIDRGRWKRDVWWMPYNEEKTSVQVEMIDTFFGSGKGKLKMLRKMLPILRKR